MPNNFDLIVIGSGPAGEKGAAQAAALGKKVALVERAPQLGGTGINTGTFPSKMLRETALYVAGLRQRGLQDAGYTLKKKLSLSDFMYHRDVVTEHAWGVIQRNLERYNIRIVRGHAELQDANTVRVQRDYEGELQTIDLKGEIILLAPGAAPYHPPHIPFDHPRIYDSDMVLRMTQVPHSLIIIGGGTIGCEYGSIFSALGTKVTLVEARDQLLPFADRELSARLQQRLERDGMRFIFNEKSLDITPGDDAVRLRVMEKEVIEAEACLFAMGRIGNSQGLGLENVGIQPNVQGLVAANANYQTAVPNIYAVGDIIGLPALASTSMEQACQAMLHAFQPRSERQTVNFPLAVYTIPEIGMIGPTEEVCREKNIPYLVGRAPYNTNPRGQIIGDSTGLLKLLFAPDTLKLLAVHIVGEQASELIHLGAYVLTQGGTIEAFSQGVYNYPTLSEMYKYAALDGLDKLPQR